MGTIAIVYPSGSHGAFLNFLLNTLSGVQGHKDDNIVYDEVTYEGKPLFYALHSINENNEHKKIINIVVSPQSYLKYIVQCFSRTSGHNYTVEDLSTNTFNKLNNHIIFKHFTNSLTVVSGKDKGDVEKKYLREWIRSCFFSGHGKTISEITNQSIVADADIQFNFEWFYQPKLLIEKCHNINNFLNIPIKRNIVPLLDSFYRQNRYKFIDIYTHQILHAIENRKFMPINESNCFQEAWIDNWLVENYKLDSNDIFLNDEYFSNTIELIKHYKI